MKSNLFQFCGGYQSAAELLTKADLYSATYVGVLAILKNKPKNIYLILNPKKNEKTNDPHLCPLLYGTSVCSKPCKAMGTVAGKRCAALRPEW